MHAKLIILLLSILTLSSCDTGKNLHEEAERIAKNSIIIDTHIDVPYRIVDQWEDVSNTTNGGDFDYPRAVAGGLNAPFMSIYTPANLEAEGKSKERAEQLIDIVNRIVNESPEKFAIALTPNDIEKQFKENKISLPMGMENGSPIEGNLENIEYFFNKGIRYITLAHSLSNHISDSSYDENKAHGGLSEFGGEVVHEMNRIGMIIDISHVSDDAFWDVMEISTAPAIASHSSARHFTPGFERNMNDEMIKKLAENDGIIMINFGSAFLTADANKYNSKRNETWEKLQNNNDQEIIDIYGSDNGDARDRFNEEYAKLNPYPYTTLEETLDHFDHVVQLTGSINHVGIGSDYDGVGSTLPIGLKDVSMYPNLVKGLLKRNYTESDIKKVLGENLLRVWRSIESKAE